MSLIIDAIKKAQELRLKDLKAPPFFRGPAPGLEKRRMKRRYLWALGAVGLCPLLIFLGGLSYSRWKPHESQRVVSGANHAAREATQKDIQGPPKEGGVLSLTGWPSLREKYEANEAGRHAFEKPKAEEKKEKRVTLSAESQDRKRQNPPAKKDEVSAEPKGAQREAGIESDEKLLAPLPKQETSLESKNPEPEKKQVATLDVLIHFNSGVSFYNQRDYAKAIGAYLKVIELDPRYAEAHNNLGIIYQELGDFDRALSAYQKAIEINPKYEKALNNLGVLLYLKGRYEESAQAFQKALTLNANNIESHINLGILFKKQGQVDQAIESYHRALAIDPFHGEAHYNTGLLYEELGNLEMAINHYQKFVQIASKAHPDLVSKVRRHLNYLMTIKK